MSENKLLPESSGGRLNRPSGSAPVAEQPHQNIHSVDTGFTRYAWILKAKAPRGCTVLSGSMLLTPLWRRFSIMKTRLFNYIEKFTINNWKFSDKNSDVFHISAQNIDCGYSLEPPRRGGSNEYPQSMFLSRNKKNNVYPCEPQFYYIKVGFKGVKII